MAKIKLFNMDCLDFMKNESDNKYDLAFTDPPYNVGRKYNEYNDNNLYYYKWCDEWFSELQRISKCQVLTVGYKNIKYWINKNPKHMMIWYKKNQNSPSPLGGFNVYEPIFVFGKGHNRIGHDVIQTNISMQKSAEWHDCPKHLQSWKDILVLFSKDNFKIIDPFGGSMTTAIACSDLGLDLDICEIDKKYFNLGKNRLEKHQSQIRMF